MQALNQVNPSGVDLSSGVERTPGDKDLDKVTKLFQSLKNIGYLESEESDGAGEQHSGRSTEKLASKYLSQLCPSALPRPSLRPLLT